MKLQRRHKGRGLNREQELNDPLPKLWKGVTAFILGGGYSLKSINLEPIKHRRIIAINNAYGDPIKVNRKGKAKYYEPRTWVDICWFGDRRWFGWHYQHLKRFNGIIAHCSAGMENVKGLVVYKRGKPAGIETKPGLVSWNGNSGISAINFAYHLGVTKVVLLGFDMKKVDNQSNWHQDHPSPNKDPYGRYLARLQVVDKDAKKLGLEIINCSLVSAIPYWPKMTLESYLESEEIDL